MVRDHVPHAQVFEIPHLFVPPPAGAAAGLTGIWFGVFGHLRETKRVPVVLRAFHRVRAALPGAKLLVAGAWVSTELHRALNRELLSEGVALSDHVPEAQFWQNARAMIACINLRWPTAGETSGIGVRLMGIGKPVMVTEAEEVSGFPEISCLRIPPGLAEEETLERMMLWMATEPEHRRAVGEAARAPIAEYHSGTRVAEMYWRVLREAA